MKKMIMMLLVLLMAAALAACKTEPAVPAASASQPQQTDGTEPETEHLVGDPEETEPQNGQEEQGVLEPYTMTFDAPITLVEADDVTITVSGVGMNDSAYLVVDTLAKNSNSDMTYEVSIPRAAVNGVEIYPTYSEDVEYECDEPIEIDLSNVIEYAKISEITDVELTFHIENDDWETVYHDTVHIYPYGQNKAVKYTRKTADTDIVLVDDSKMTVTVLGCEYIQGWGYSVRLYVQNKTAEPFYLDAE